MPTSKKTQKIVICMSDTGITIRVNEVDVMKLNSGEARNLGEAMFKAGTNMQMKENNGR